MLTWLFCQGGAYTPAQVAVRLGVETDSARKLLTRISRVLPIARGDDAAWRVVRPPSDELLAVEDEIERRKAYLRQLNNKIAVAERKLADKEELMRARAKNKAAARRLARLAAELEA